MYSLEIKEKNANHNGHFDFGMRSSSKFTGRSKKKKGKTIYLM